MKALIQRVMKASVSVAGDVASSIDQGICILIGISNNDTPKDMEYIAKKILSVRLFDNADGKRWASNVVEKDLEILCVSQFTLYSVLKGTKPDFHKSMPGEKSKQFYEDFLKTLKKSYKPEKIKDGVFGAYMQVHIQNDGPVTIEIESPTRDTKNNDSNGVFGAYMQVHIQNDGPVTIEIESPTRDTKNNASSKDTINVDS